MTQQGLADAAGVDLKTIYNLESGTRWPIAKTRVAVSAALGWAPDTLSAIAEGSIPQPRPTGIPVIDQAATDEELEPYVRQIRRQIADAVADYGPEVSGEIIFGPGHEADAWNAKMMPPDATVKMLALFRLWAHQNIGGESGARTGLNRLRLLVGST
jgi:DNA-binding XRE family transcriptional regulator